MTASNYQEAELIMKRSLHITATVDQPDLLKNLVEKLAYRRNDSMSATIPSPENQVFETSSTVAYVSGTMGIDFTTEAGDEQLNIPFITCFLFTCIKPDSSPYELAWSQSLS